jgi:hypothetical protein
MYARTRQLLSLASLLGLLLAWPGIAAAEEAVVVRDAYMDLHSGPGRGYPVFHIVERGEEVLLLKRRTDWFKLRTADGIEGWASRASVERTETVAGVPRTFADATQQQFLGRRFEFGFASGDFDGDQVFSFRAGYRVSEIFTTELTLSQVSGTFSSTTLYHANLVASPFMDWRIAPFFTLGWGRFENEPKQVLVDNEDINEWAANVGVGARAYLGERFLFRADWRDYIVMVDDNNNEDFSEWTLGFAVFF